MKCEFMILNENTIQKYNGEILKRLVGNRVVKVISNPTERDLKEFGYMELVPQDSVPEYDPNTQTLETFYEIREGTIYESLRPVDLIFPVDSNPDLEE